jgi:hypothetical protein
MSDCIEWKGPRNPTGYGRLSSKLAHRVAWTAVHGDPGDQCVLHTCDNRACINVEHLFLGTQRENLDDMTRKGRRHYKLSDQDVADIRTSSERGVDLARRYGVTEDTVSRIRHGKLRA